MRRVPALTLAVVVLTGAVAGVGLSNGSVLDGLRRDPRALGAGQWWRLLSPLLVRADSATGVRWAVASGSLRRPRTARQAVRSRPMQSPCQRSRSSNPGTARQTPARRSGAS